MCRLMFAEESSKSMIYDLIATLGPASQDKSTWREMQAAGVTAFRLNTSHLAIDSLWAWLERLAPFLAEAGPSVRLVLDLQGSKWRLGQFPSFMLHEGQVITLVHAMESERENVLPVPHADFFRAAAQSSDEILLNDAKSMLIVESTGAEAIRARVMLGGEISPRKGITFGASTFRTETLSEKDRTIFIQTRDLCSIQYAVSYVKDAIEMEGYRALFGPEANLIAKLERSPAMQDAAQIATFADTLWVCRGDLGAELGLKGMAEAVARFSTQAKALPAIMAGQVLEHMTEHTTPTRSEVCYLFDALQAGYRGFVLSDETAIGRYPVEACWVAAMFMENRFK